MQISSEGKIGISLALVGLLGGGAIVRYPDQAWIGTAMMAVAVLGIALLILHHYRSRHQKTAEHQKPRALEYLSSKDVELGSAIQRMARQSAWGRWFAAKHLATSKVPITDAYLLEIAASVMRDPILDGTLTVRGRLPGKLAYEVIERTFWRSSAFWFQPHPTSLWRLEIIPVGGVTIEADGKLKAFHKPSEKRNAVIRKYDSLLIDAHEFESVWPKNDAATDKARRAFLKQAMRQRLDKQTIKLLS